jgi:hypothetical protein
MRGSLEPDVVLDDDNDEVVDDDDADAPAGAGRAGKAKAGATHSPRPLRLFSQPSRLHLHARACGAPVSLADAGGGGSAVPAAPATFEGIDLNDPVLEAIAKAAAAAKAAAVAAGVTPAPELHSEYRPAPVCPVCVPGRVCTRRGSAPLRGARWCGWASAATVAAP